VCRRVLVSGRVQGVGYRAFARSCARALDIRGHAVNLPDGNVEVLACGEAAALEEFIARLREGPRWSLVAALDVRHAECGADQGFRTG